MININNIRKPLLIATQNPGKVIELRSLLEQSGLHFELLTPGQLGLEMDVPEDGDTYQQNAALKAAAFCKASGLLSLADDSGLEVDALNGQPGVHSARYAPPPGEEPWHTPPEDGDAMRRAWLLYNLKGFERPWKACFHCTVAVADAAGRVDFSEGRCPGEIVPEERGSGGFGYDPIFQLEGMRLTMSELSIEQKNQLSHRARALQAAVPILRSRLDLG